MKCPNCGNRKSIEVDMHSAGFTADESPVKECGACGLVWSVATKGGSSVIDIIKPAREKKD